MKILIGTPIHEAKDYCLERWLDSVAKQTYPADLLMIDNSSGPEYVKKVESYCQKMGIKNYEIKHIDLPLNQEVHERVARSREIIRQEILAHSYDAWFSWECDQIIPDDALDELVSTIQFSGATIVDHNGWSREDPELPRVEITIALIKRQCLEKNSFLLDFGAQENMLDSWVGGEVWFKNRVLKDGGSYMDLYGVIKPILHLDR